MNQLNDILMNFHPLHAVGFGVLGGYIGQKYGYDFTRTAAVVSVGTYAYMNKYGHALPGANNEGANTEPVSGILLVTEPTKGFDSTTATPQEKVSYYNDIDREIAAAKQRGSFANAV
jgi:hypothetical protein